MPQQDKTPSREAQPDVGRSLTGSGALQLVQAVTENPTVAGVAAGVITAKATLMMSKPKDPPPPTDPPAA